MIETIANNLRTSYHWDIYSNISCLIKKMSSRKTRKYIYKIQCKVIYTCGLLPIHSNNKISKTSDVFFHTFLHTFLSLLCLEYFFKFTCIFLLKYLLKFYYFVLILLSIGILSYVFQLLERGGWKDVLFV